jgi:hypothetical protein
MSTSLSVDGRVRAALNLYAAAPNAFGEHCRTLAGLFGIQAALLLYGASEAAHLQRAVDSRDLIGRAKGILMERFKTDDEGAFQMLVKTSQDTNLKLTKVAEWLDTETSQRHTPARSSGGSCGEASTYLARSNGLLPGHGESRPRCDR